MPFYPSFQVFRVTISHQKNIFIFLTPVYLTTLNGEETDQGTDTKCSWEIRAGWFFLPFDHGCPGRLHHDHFTLISISFFLDSSVFRNVSCKMPFLNVASTSSVFIFAGSLNER